jgi:hypothetical protein
MAAEIERHLAACSDCRTLLEDNKKMTEKLELLSVPDPGDEYWNRLEKDVLLKISSDLDGGRPTRIPDGFAGLRRILALAAILVLMVLSISIAPRIPVYPGDDLSGSNQYVYDPRIIGHYYGDRLEGDEIFELAPNVLAAAPFSPPGMPGYGLSMIIRIQTWHGRQD